LKVYGDNVEVIFKDLSHEALVATEFNKILSLRQPHRGVKVL